MNRDVIATINFALYPTYNIRLALFHNIKNPSAVLNIILDSDDLKDRFTLVDATNIISIQHVAVAANLVFQRKYDALMKENTKTSVHDSMNANDDETRNYNHRDHIAQEIATCVGGGSSNTPNVWNALPESSFENDTTIQERIDDTLYSVVALGVSFSSDDEFLSTFQLLGLSSGAESFTSMKRYFSRTRTDLEMKQLSQIYKLTQEEVQYSSSLENAIITRIATKGYTKI
jgi:hypothetical protein